MNKRVIIVIIIIVIIGINKLYCEAGASGGQFMQISVEARGTSLSGAMVTSSRGVESLYWNVAGLSRMVKENEVSISYNKWILEMNYMKIGYSKKINILGSVSKGEALGIEVGYGLIGGFEARDEAGVILNRETEVMNIGGAVGYSILIGSIRAGLGIKFYNEKIFDESKILSGIDVGGIWEIVENRKESIGLGVAVKNIGYDSFGEKMPMKIEIGGNYKIGIMGGYSIEGMVGSDIYIYESPVINIGIEYGYKGAVYVRSGYKLDTEGNSLGWMNGINLGIGGVYKGIRLDIGYTSVGILGNSFQTTLCYGF